MATTQRRTAAHLLVDCLAAEGCDYVFSVPGEETMDILDALSDHAAVRHITTRHEQGAAFMADVHGRLTGRAAVAMSTLGPGATNLLTGVADAFLDRAPMVAITGQASSDKLHKEAHQVVDIVGMLAPVTKWNTSVQRIGAIPEIVRKAFRTATLEKPGPTHIELPENLAAMAVEPDATPLVPGQTYFPEATAEAIAHAADLIANSQRPIILAGNGVLRRRASAELRALARGLHIPVAVTFMGKGAIDDRSHLSLMAVGLQARDHVLSGFDRADLVICVGYDLVEYAPAQWNPDGTKRIVHIDTQPAEVDAQYRPEVELIGDIDGSLSRLLAAVQPRGISGRNAGERHEARETLVHADLRNALLADLQAGAASDDLPIMPQRAIADLREVLAPDDIVVSDVGAHKVWVARLYQTYEPNTVIISNGFAAMGISLPGAIAAKLVHPDRRVVALCGDGGFLMNSQELETAKRIGTNVTVVVWRDDGYGLIDWKQRNEFGRPFGVEFGNPDFVAYAESFGIAGFRPASAAELRATLGRALEVDGPSLVEIPIDYRENLRLTERLGALAGA
ncbi:MAG TPA: acetolactate synthase large subunit [Candidatus Limnocylindrales bacterium]|jgi:acetolactate synthase-1/2/3 large subunit|nr:acetolactate synthase large subunit [Candidatus Limnocylindrales bacterium]